MRRLLALSAGLVVLLLAAASPVAAQTTPGASPDLPPNVARACPVPAAPGTARCHALVRTDVHGPQPTTATPSGYGPSNLQSAYKLPSATAGSGQTVALVDAYDDPNAESDLAVYRSQYGLPACTTANGCFRKVTQSGTTTGYPSGNTGWAEEISLDLDMVSAICPNCRILLVEANSNYFSDLGTAVNEAATLGANAISNSYGGSEGSWELAYDTQYYNHPGVAVTASSGDGGYGVEYPAASPDVTAVGGTTLTTASNSRGWSETVWSGSGSGCSAYEKQPSWQQTTLTSYPSVCSRRVVADVAADANPNTGVAVYDTYGEAGWLVFGGTSVASPIIASVYALAGNAASVTTPVNGVGGYGSYPYTHTAGIFEVTSGKNSRGPCRNYLCEASTSWPGYSGPTGLGTPNGTNGIPGF